MRNVLFELRALVEGSVGRVTVDVTGYEREIEGKLADLTASAHASWRRARESPPDWTALVSEVRDLVGDEMARKMDPVDLRWGPLVVKALLARSRKAADEKDWDLADRVYKASATIRAWEKTLEDEPEDFGKDLPRMVDAARRLAEKVAEQVRAAVGRVERWGSSPVTVRPRAGGEWLDPPGAFDVALGGGGSRFSADFTAFTDVRGKIDQLDDVLEGGDRDFFTSPELEADYFALVQEIRRPGSTRSKGKVLTLYTARPVQDRRLYDGAREVPSGIFLTSDPDRAEGLAGDLGGSSRRDVYRIRISDRWLVKTLDTGRIKDFQALNPGGKVPVVDVDRFS